MPPPSRPKLSAAPATLAELQRLLAQAVMRPLRADESMHAANAEIATKIIKPNDRLTSFDRLQIYNQQYWWRLLASFAEDYRGLRAVLGPRKFDRLAEAYVRDCGSTSWTMRNLGRQLESFLVAHPELTAPQTALALEVARVEWARIVAFDDPMLPVLQPERIAATPPDRLQIKLQPYLTLLTLAYPVDELLLKMKESNIETGAFSNAVSSQRTSRAYRISAPPSAQPIYLAVHRHELSVFYKRLEPEAHRLLCALRKGSSLESACAEAFADSDAAPEANAAKLQQWFATWMHLGWLCR